MKETLIGTVLGDGRLERHGQGVRLAVNHAAAQKAYIQWKHQELLSLRPSPLHFHSGGRYPFWRFVTGTHPLLEELWRLFYVDGRKRVPEEIDRLLTSPKALAVWFMDDGTCDKRQGSVLFETQGFLLEDIERLQRCLESNFQLDTVVHRSGRGRGLRLYLPVREAHKMALLIQPFVLPEMRYKLPRSL